MTLNRILLAVPAVLALAFTITLSACSGPPETVANFAQLDSKGQPIQCTALIATNKAETDQVESALDEHIMPVVMKAAQNGYAFQQCHAEIEADRHARCEEYAARLKQSMTGDAKSTLGPWLQYDHLPEEWSQTCAPEIRSGIAGVNNGYNVELGGPNPILTLSREDVSVPLSSVTKISMDSRDAAVDLWRIKLDTTGSGYSLWFSTEAKASAAYNALRSAWKQTRITARASDSNS